MGAMLKRSRLKISRHRLCQHNGRRVNCNTGLRNVENIYTSFVANMLHSRDIPASAFSKEIRLWLQPCCPLKILHLCHCCSNVSGYQRGPVFVTRLSQTNLMCQGEWTQICNSRSQRRFAKIFFFFLYTYKKDHRESRELPQGLFASAEG